MKSIIEVIEANVVFERHPDIHDLARQKNPEKWAESSVTERRASEEIKKAGATKALLDYESCLTAQMNMLMDAAYLIGVSDGMTLERNRAELQKEESATGR